MAVFPKPPYDPELGGILNKMPIPAVRTREMIPMMRSSMDQMSTAQSAVAGRSITHEERKIPGPNGDITLSIFRNINKEASTTGKPGIYFMHGGGMITGNRFFGIKIAADWIEQCDAVCISVEYRLAPEHTAPGQLEDCYAGLSWVADNFGALGIDPEKLIVAGESAGGGLAAGLALLARDRGSPKISAQVLMCPMLDDRNNSISSQQYANEGTWSGQANAMAWKCVLGDLAGGAQVDIYTAPGRATDLSRLPPAFVDVGSAECFRDEAIAYASLLWASGVQTELHVWPGAFHGFDLMAPTATLSQVAIRTRLAWVRRVLGC
jgi:acetyl esterase/lipase